MKNLLTSDIIKSEREREVSTMKEYKFLVRVYLTKGVDKGD
nr:MAG TPA: hypothetical protein [Microviridae sp.]